MLLMALVAVKIIDMTLPAHSVLYDDDVSSLVPLYALLGVSLFLLWQFVLNWLLGLITRSEGVVHLRALMRMLVVRSSVVLYPVLACWLVADGDTQQWWSVMTIICASIVAISYLKDCFLLFLAKKISIFYWFLYLCTAILLPCSFVSTMLALCIR